MPQIVPVSDFRSDINSVARYTDAGEVVVLTQNGHPRWAMVNYDDWNAAARAQERAFSRAVRETEQLESAGDLELLSADEFQKRRAERRMSRHSQEV